MQPPDNGRQIAGRRLMMVRQRVANTLKLGERDAQGRCCTPRSLITSRSMEIQLSRTCDSGSERVSRARSCHTTCEQFNSTTPQRSSQRRESESAVVQLADMMVNQRFILAFAQMWPAAQLIDKTPAQLPNMPAAFTRVRARA